jgi:hypothetical protein
VREVGALACAWSAAKVLRAFFLLRIRARRGHQVAAVAVDRKLAVLYWHLLTKDRLSLGLPGAGRQQVAGDGAAGRRAGEEGQQAERGVCLRRQAVSQ